MIVKNIEFNRLLYHFTALVMCFGMVGLYMGASFLQIFAIGGRQSFGLTLIIVLIDVGSFATLTGILLHSFKTSTLEAQNQQQ